MRVRLDGSHVLDVFRVIVGKIGARIGPNLDYLAGRPAYRFRPERREAGLLCTCRPAVVQRGKDRMSFPESDLTAVYSIIVAAWDDALRMRSTQDE